MFNPLLNIISNQLNLEVLERLSLSLSECCDLSKI